MKKVVKLTESKLMNLIRQKLNEDTSEYYEISAQEYLQLLKMTGYNAIGLSKTKRFGGKPIKVIGNLDLRSTPIRNLGKLYITGNLDAQYSKLDTLDDVICDGRISTWSTPIEEKIKARKRYEELEGAKERRSEGVWDINNEYIDTEGEMANAAFDLLIMNGEISAMDDDERIEYQRLNDEYGRIESEMESTEDEDMKSELSDDLDEIQEDLDSLESKNNDVYGLIPYGTHYSMTTFKTRYNELDGAIIAVGTVGDADRSLYEYMDDLVDEVRYKNFNYHFIERHIDGDSVADYLEVHFREDIYHNPEGWDIPRELSKSQKEEIWLLEMEKWVYENEGVRVPVKYPTMEGNGTIFDFLDNDDNQFLLKYEGNRWVLYKEGSIVQPNQLYDDEDTEEHQNERDERISDIEYEIQSIKSDPDGELDEDKVEEELEDKLDEIRSNPMDYIREYDLDIENLINHRDFVQGLVDEADYGRLNGLDETYEEIDINGTTYIVMLIDK